jgi:hypothetical protein
MATASLSGLPVPRLPDLLILVKRTAEWARNLRLQNLRAAMIPDEVQQAKALFARARAWPLNEPLLRAEPKWRKPGDVEAAFFALYDALRSQTRAWTLGTSDSFKLALPESNF